MGLPLYAQNRPLSQPCVAITGGIGAGKSAALEILRKSGYRTASADEAAREVLKGETVRAKIGEKLSLPENFTSSDLQEKLALDPGVAEFLNDLTHPLIWNRMAEAEAEFYEVPLLFEMGLEAAFTESWLIWCSDEVKFERLRARYGSEVGAKIGERQMAREQKKLLSSRQFRSDVLIWEEESVLLQAARTIFGH